MASRAGVKCQKCGKHFRDTSNLSRHLHRKTPCDAILNPEDIPEGKKENPKCGFCGRVFSSQLTLSNHIKKSCKIIPRNGDTSGMDKLYEHVLKRQEERHKAELTTFKKEVEIRMGMHDAKEHPLVGEVKVANVNVNRGVVDQSTKNITINIFGSENTSHITHANVLGLFRKLGPLGSDIGKAGEKLILSMAMMIFSDDKHPENITCYLPNKKGKEVLVHGESGWEVMPVSLSLSPMASKSVDELFAKQPWPGMHGISSDEQLEGPTKILGHIKKHEGDIVNSISAPGSDLRAIPIRNKEILERVLSRLPKAGEL